MCNGLKFSLGFLLAAISLCPAATLIWETAGDAALATGFKIYRSPWISPPAWSLIGTSGTTNFVVTQGGFYQVTGTNSFGESGPSNIATNTFVAPGSPSNAVIRASIEAGNTPTGPWMEITNILTTVPLASQGQFYRSQLTVALER